MRKARGPFFFLRLFLIFLKTKQHFFHIQILGKSVRLLFLSPCSVLPLSVVRRERANVDRSHEVERCRPQVSREKQKTVLLDLQKLRRWRPRRRSRGVTPSSPPPPLPRSPCCSPSPSLPLPPPPPLPLPPPPPLPLPPPPPLPLSRLRAASGSTARPRTPSTYP